MDKYYYIHLGRNSGLIVHSLSLMCVFFPSCFDRTKALVLELLAAVCLVRGGHEIILSAFDNFKEVGYSSFKKNAHTNIFGHL